MDRRRFLALTGGAGGALLVPGLRHAASAADGDRAFRHGIASGDPLADRVILWTRVSPAGAGPVPVEWVVASDRGLQQVVAAGTVMTSAEQDFTVKVDATGLVPATTYFYGFRALGASSPTGRTRTAPAATAEVAVLRFAVVSCANLGVGWFNPYGRIAERRDLDAVLHVGDYFYEGSTSSVRPVSPPHEIVTLADYRERHACYRLDPDLQAATAAHPWICTWDDHESANDAWLGGSDNHEPSEGSWPERRAAAVRAYLEWLPVRPPDPADPLRIWRHLPFGNLADLLVLDTRLYGRNAPETPTGTFDTGSNDPSRTMLGDVQRAWLYDRLAGSAGRGAAWRVLAQQTMISPHRDDPMQPPLPYLPEHLVELLGLRQGGGNEGGDNWGAYWRERDDLIAFLRTRGIRDNVVVTGDIHSAWACDVTEDPYNPLAYEQVTGSGSVAVELVCTSVTSHNLQESGPELAPALNAAIIAANPNVTHSDVAGHGYTVVELTPAGARAEFWETGDARVRSTSHDRTASFEWKRGTDHVGPAGLPSLDRIDRVVGDLLA